MGVAKRIVAGEFGDSEQDIADSAEGEGYRVSATPSADGEGGDAEDGLVGAGVRRRLGAQFSIDIKACSLTVNMGVLINASCSATLGAFVTVSGSFSVTWYP